MEDELYAKLRCQITINGTHKVCEVMKTAGKWTWKLSSSKECVTTHLPNHFAAKMDGARMVYRYFAVVVDRNE